MEPLVRGVRLQATLCLGNAYTSHAPQPEVGSQGVRQGDWRHSDLEGHFLKGPGPKSGWRWGVVWEGRLLSKFHSCFHGTGGLIREIRHRPITYL